MKILRADWVNKVDLEKLLTKQAKSTGFFSKKSLETLEGFKTIERPFQKVILNSIQTSDDIVQIESYIDVQNAPLIEDQNHRMLLWRPKILNYTGIETDKTVQHNNTDAIQTLVDDMMEKRWEAQEFDEEIRPKLKRLQADPLSTISFLIPRTPGGLRKEQVIIDERKSPHAYILATSLITNSSPRDVIISSNLGETVLVETIIGIYKSKNDSLRILALETPGSRNFNDAMKAGRALSRLCEIYGDCRELVLNASM